MQQLTTQQTNGVTAPADVINTQPIYIRISDHLESRIKAGEWQLLQPLPTTEEFARQYRCALGTMRNAMDILKAKGVLIIKKGRGTFIVDKDAADQAKTHACVGKSLHIIKQAIDEAGAKNVSAKLQTCLQKHIKDALLKAGYRGEAET